MVKLKHERLGAVVACKARWLMGIRIETWPSQGREIRRRRGRREEASALHLSASAWRVPAVGDCADLTC